MIRTLIIAALMTGAATHFLHTDPYEAFGYSLVLSVTLWFFWPLLRRLVRLALRRRRRHRAPARTPKTASPQLTQVNHYHFYGHVPAAAQPMPRPDYSRPALPVRTEGQKAHDAIYDIIDMNDDTTR
ncbi:hypothetical protein [Mycolicibacterium gilvum]|uniref:Transmembrane protein n=1 Tax=Mycolicibacterium gilvum TaxID=1804 RepID=A0A378SKJ1_9MYCO|nr:hypothetical protein [Mycolicibacterium gilvum]MCV7058389.1 hypothetical protein [Mycolicibacterium gilvum]STZ41262.1 Uncharacterised protein [Mycolicibacterium gilvum]STZ43111.1 Uncharacterised protein [Mycolicibacterium gilvum]